MPSREPSQLVKHTVNGLIDHVLAHPTSGLPAETQLAAKLGVSRSPLRVAMELLRSRGVLDDRGIARLPWKSDRFPAAPKPRSKAEDFADVFLGKLARGDLQPGQRFSELELAREAGLSTVTIREALLAVGVVGLISKEPRCGWTVVRFTSGMVEEFYEERILLEVAALRRAITNPALPEVLRGLLAEHKVMQRTPHDVDGFLDLDQRFHGALFRAGGNRFMLHDFAAISTLLRYQLQPTTVGQASMERGLEQHPPIIAAVIDGDLATSERLLREHLATSRELMKCTVSGDDPPMARSAGRPAH